MRELFVNINPFVMQQNVAIVKDGLTPLFSCSLEDLGIKLAEYSAAENVTEIKISGNKDFSEKVVADFWTKSGELYANQNVKIGVI